MKMEMKSSSDSSVTIIAEYSMFEPDLNLAYIRWTNSYLKVTENKSALAFFASTLLAISPRRLFCGAPLSPTSQPLEAPRPCPSAEGGPCSLGPSLGTPRSSSGAHAPQWFASFCSEPRGTRLCLSSFSADGNSRCNCWWWLSSKTIEDYVTKKENDQELRRKTVAMLFDAKRVCN